MVLTPITADDLAVLAAQSREVAADEKLITKSPAASLAYETGYLAGMAAVAEILRERAADEAHLTRVLGCDETTAETALEALAKELEAAIS